MKKMWGDIKMVGKGLKDLCKEYPLKSSNGVVYGVIGG